MTELVVAGVDDATAKASGVDGHGANLDAALADADPALPVLLLAHQPKQVTAAAQCRCGPADLRAHPRRADLAVQLPRQTRSAGSARVEPHGERTQLYTSRGTGFWGPPFRVFAPSEITVLTLRRG